MDGKNNLPTSTGPHWDNLASKPITNVHGVTRDSLQIELAQVCSCFTYGMVFAKTLLRDDNLLILIADPIIKLLVSDYELILYTSIAISIIGATLPSMHKECVHIPDWHSSPLREAG